MLLRALCDVSFESLLNMVVNYLLSKGKVEQYLWKNQHFVMPVCLLFK